MLGLEITSPDIFRLLRATGKRCSTPIDVYLIGGGAMALRGDRRSTMDLDMVLALAEEAAEFKAALEAEGALVNARGAEMFRGALDNRPVVDLFVKRICNALHLSESMMGRAETFLSAGQVNYRMISREDIFLLKSITERPRDLNEMLDLYRKSLRGDVIINECEVQDDLEDPEQPRVWESFVLLRVQELETKFGIEVPWKNRLLAMAEIGIGSTLILQKAHRGIGDIEQIRKDLGLDRRDFDRCLSFLESRSMAEVDRTAKPPRIRVKNEM